jgi:hypothetical protein
VTKCIFCGGRAKRICSAQFKRPICARCCKARIASGEKCPPECPFFSSDQSYRNQKTTRKYSQRLRQEEELLASGLTEQQLDLFFKLEAAIRRNAKENRFIADVHILRATEALLERFRMHTIGLIAPKKIAVRQEEIIMNAIEEAVNRKETEPSERQHEQDRPNYSDEEIVGVLNQLKASIERHQRSGAGYIAFLNELG